MKRWGLLVAVVVAAVIGGAQVAHANSGSLSLADAGGGSMTATLTLSVDDCGDEFCGWYAIAYERHSSLTCLNDAVNPRALTTFYTTPGIVTYSETFRPFFPRSAKLCLYLFAVGHTPQLAAELQYDVPSGYGHLRSTGYNCSNFSNRAQAAYYLELYPDDPSRLDADSDGSPCEANPCPCGAEVIPPEPMPAPASATIVIPPPTPAPIWPGPNWTHRCEQASQWTERARERARSAKGTLKRMIRQQVDSIWIRAKRKALKERRSEVRDGTADEQEICSHIS